MPRTAFTHFEEDIERASELVVHAKSMGMHPTNKRLRDDILRSAWMMAVGALDAYLSDAYVDVVARTIRGKALQDDIRLDPRIESLEFPLKTYFNPYKARSNWRWRMAAKRLMERESILSLEKAKDLLNPFLSQSHKLFTDSHIVAMVEKYSALKRVFDVGNTGFAQLSGNSRSKVIKRARNSLYLRFRNIFQRRHDCIHNCDRPLIALQHMKRPGTVRNVIADIDFITQEFNSQIEAGFKAYLKGIGCDSTTLNSLGFLGRLGSG